MGLSSIAIVITSLWLIVVYVENIRSLLIGTAVLFAGLSIYYGTQYLKRKIK